MPAAGSVERKDPLPTVSVPPNQVFKSKNTQLKFQGSTLKTIVVPYHENTNVSILITYLLKEISWGEHCLWCLDCLPINFIKEVLYAPIKWCIQLQIEVLGGNYG